MRTALLLTTLALPVLVVACGARSEGDWLAPSSGGGAASATGGAPSVSGGAPASGGVPVTGGIASGGGPSGGTAAGGSASGGVSFGGAATGGAATGGQVTGGVGSGGKPCFETTQAGAGVCIHVRLCSEAQYETLCLLDTPMSVVCFCYTDGAVTSAASVLSAPDANLCDEAERSRCP